MAAAAQDSLLALGHDVIMHDLYKEGFDPVLGAPELARSYSLDDLVQVHCRELAACDGLLVFHPDWWGQPPAILKGWLDRVFRQGVAYELGGDAEEKDWTPLLNGKKGLVFCTSDAKDDVPRTLETLWTDVILARCGMKAECHVIRNMRGTDPGSRRAWLESMLSIIADWFPPAVRQSQSRIRTAFTASA
jgi:putative NADPH-quinone reductase